MIVWLQRCCAEDLQQRDTRHQMRMSCSLKARKAGNRHKSPAQKYLAANEPSSLETQQYMQAMNANSPCATQEPNLTFGASIKRLVGLHSELQVPRDLPVSTILHRPVSDALAGLPAFVALVKLPTLALAAIAGKHTLPSRKAKVTTSIILRYSGSVISQPYSGFGTIILELRPPTISCKLLRFS